MDYIERFIGIRMYNKMMKMMFNRMSGGAGAPRNGAMWGMLFVMTLLMLALKGAIVMWSWNAVMPKAMESLGYGQGYGRPISWLDGVLLVILAQTLLN